MKKYNEVGMVLIAIATISVAALGQTKQDNSKVNKRDKMVSEKTADQQKGNARDIQLTTRIRREILKEKNLSTYARNIKIITINGKVTLKGPVRSTTDENTILMHARAAAGTPNVVNEIAIVSE